MLILWSSKMELGLSLGEAPKAFPLLGRGSKPGSVYGYHVQLGIGLCEREEQVRDDQAACEERGSGDGGGGRAPSDTPVQLELLPLAPVPRYSPSVAGVSGRSDNEVSSSRNLDVNQLPLAEEVDNGVGVISSPNSTASATFRMDLSICTAGTARRKRDSDQTASNELETERAISRVSDEEENGLTRKKLRLSKEQSAFLEETFKQHNTLNPKQKQALARQLRLRPRQVEVWFQNRRARTKLKQTEVDCEYLKRCCESLTEENRRLHKELQELRALKTASPFFSQLPATTLTMCPSCERVVTTTKTPNFGPSVLAKNGAFHTLQQRPRHFDASCS